jgi:hypothetical protein
MHGIKIAVTCECRGDLRRGRTVWVEDDCLDLRAHVADDCAEIRNAGIDEKKL